VQSSGKFHFIKRDRRPSRGIYSADNRLASCDSSRVLAPSKPPWARNHEFLHLIRRGTEEQEEQSNEAEVEDRSLLRRLQDDCSQDRVWTASLLLRQSSALLRSSRSAPRPSLFGNFLGRVESNDNNSRVRHDGCPDAQRGVATPASSTSNPSNCYEYGLASAS